MDNHSNLINSNYIFHKGNINKYYNELIESLRAIYRRLLGE